MEIALLRIALILYFAAAAAFIAHLITLRDGLRGSGPLLLVAAAVVHAAELALRSLDVGYIAVGRFDEGLSFLAWIVTVIYLLLHSRYVLPVLGAVIAPLAFGLTLVAFTVTSGTTELPPSLRSAWLPVHVTLAFLGNAVFALAFATSLLYLFEDNRLKAKRPQRVNRLFPSLEKLDTLNYRLLAWGFPFLTLGIVSGAVWAHFAWGQFWSWEARETWSLFTWLLYALLLQGRVTGWRGRRAATLTILGFAVLVMSFVSVNFLFPGRHGGTFGS
ncbi:MAG: c-type cytochrome biogenesis protein CcsB [Candidatus Binatia bacterium]